MCNLGKVPDPKHTNDSELHLLTHERFQGHTKVEGVGGKGDIQAAEVLAPVQGLYLAALDKDLLVFSVWTIATGTDQLGGCTRHRGLYQPLS